MAFVTPVVEHWLEREIATLYVDTQEISHCLEELCANTNQQINTADVGERKCNCEMKQSAMVDS